MEHRYRVNINIVSLFITRMFKLGEDNDTIKRFKFFLIRSIFIQGLEDTIIKEVYGVSLPLVNRTMLPRNIIVIA